MKERETITITDFSSGDCIDNFRVSADGSLEKREGCQLLYSFTEKLRGAISARENTGDVIYLVAGNTLYRYESGTATQLGTLSQAVFQSDADRVDMFFFSGKLYLLGGGSYSCWDGQSLSEVEGYIPLIRRNASSSDTGIEYERQNFLTNRVRMKLRPDGNSTQFQLYGKVSSIESISINGVLQSGNYSLLNGTYTSYVKFTYTIPYNSEDIIEVVYTLSGNSRREEITSCVHSAVYGGDTDSRVFLYGGSHAAVIYPTDPQNADSGSVLSAEYFPIGAEITVGDGNLSVSGAVRQFDRLAIFTEDGAFYTYPHEESPKNGVPRYSFPILPLNSDVGATKSGGAVLVENEPFALNENGLFRFKSTSVRDERLAILIEAPDYIGLTRTFIESCQLYVNRLRGELWCFGQDSSRTPSQYIAIYNARLGVWYRFSGIAPDFMFTYQSNAAFAIGKLLFRFDKSAVTDAGIGYAAVFQSGMLTMKHPFLQKSLYQFGATLEGNAGTQLQAAIESDRGENRSLTLSIPASSGGTPSVLLSHAKLSHAAYVTIRLTSPAGAASIKIREVMLRYRESSS